MKLPISAKIFVTIIALLLLFPADFLVYAPLNRFLAGHVLSCGNENINCGITNFLIIHLVLFLVFWIIFAWIFRKIGEVYLKKS
jgi:hypothetical protein